MYLTAVSQELLKLFILDTEFQHHKFKIIAKFPQDQCIK